MKRLFIAAALTATFCLSAAADIPSGYYNAMDGKKKEALKTAACNVIRPHTVLSYNDLFPKYFPTTDVYPEAYNGQQRWWEMYSNEVFLVRNGYSGLNREHSFPKSWWGGSQNACYTDLNHLYPSESEANTAKSNYPLGVVKNATFDNGVTRVGTPVSGQGGNASRVFEPADEYKGDFARTYFYMVTCYQDLSWKYTYMAKDGTYPSLQPWAIDLLLDWARKDPVSQKEKDRNEAVYGFQGNRNPFIDFPELAEYIWGTRTTETFYLSEQGGGTVTPPITGDPELTSPESGTSLDFPEAAVGHTVSTDLLINGINLTSALTVRITGNDRAYFSLTGVTENQIPASKINSPEGYKLHITYTPQKTGEHTALLNLYDGGLKSSVTVDLRGQGLAVPTLSAPVALDAENLSETGYTARWEAAPEGEVIDYYLVSRTRYLPTGAVTEELQAPAPGTSLLIEGRDPEVSEAYNVRSVRLGIKSAVSNTIMVAAGGVVGVEAAQPLIVLSGQGYMVIDLDTEQTGLRVFDMSGRSVMTIDRVCGGETISLPRGVYIVTTDQSQRPCKAVVF